MSSQHDGARLAPSTEGTALLYQFPKIGWERIGDELFPYFADDPDPEVGEHPLPSIRGQLRLWPEPRSGGRR